MTGPPFPQLLVSQPYTMCHALRLVDPNLDCDKLATPAFGTNLILDNREAAEAAILLCFTAPRAVQRAARAQGVAGVVMIRPPGLAEALERSRTREESDGS